LAIPFKQNKKMKVAIWDTYVEKKDGSIMHFDIVAPIHIREEKNIHTFGKDYLQLKNQENQPLTSKECTFCHIEEATDEMKESIEQRGYYIIEMQGCD
jgi:hypothetical protein